MGMQQSLISQYPTHFSSYTLLILENDIKNLGAKALAGRVGAVGMRNGRGRKGEDDKPWRKGLLKNQKKVVEIEINRHRFSTH